MNQIRTYSKTRPKSVILYEKGDTIFQSIDIKSKSDNGSGDKSDKQELILENKKIRPAGVRKMRPVTDNKSCQRTLKSQNKIVGHKTAPLKSNHTKTMQSLKRSSRKTKKQKQLSQNTKQQNQSQNEKKSTKFTWPESDDDSEPSIEIFRKDEGMTWQQKISFLLPKMHQEYTNKGTMHRETYKGKISSPLLNISAEEVEEDSTEIDSEDYTYTWVTATNTKSNIGQSSVPSSKYVTDSSHPNSTVGTSKTRTGKLKLPVKNLTKSITIHDPSVNEFLDKDKDGISINQKWNSTIQKYAQNIKECGFPVDVSSIKLCQSGSKKTGIQLNQETTPDKGKILHREPSRPKKKKIGEKHFNSTKMFLSDHIAFVDMVPEMSTIYKVSGKTDDSIEVTRDKSPFVKFSKAESPITPFISPKKDDNEPVFTSTPTKDKDHKVKEFPEFDLSSVQIPEFDEDELEIHESRVVNSQEIVCDPTEEDLEVLETAPCDEEVLQLKIDMLNYEKIENHSKKSAKLSQKLIFETDRCHKDKDSFQNDEDLTPIENLTFVPIKQSSESRQNAIHKSFCGNKTKMNRTNDDDLEECCITAFKVPLKPIRKVKSCIDYEHILKTTPIDCMQQIF